MRMIGVLPLLLALLPDSTQAQAFPTRQITIVVPYPPGASADLIPRALAPVMSKIAGRFEQLGLSVVADSPEEFARFVAAESERMRKLVEVSGVRVD